MNRIESSLSVLVVKEQLYLPSSRCNVSNCGTRSWESPISFKSTLGKRSNCAISCPKTGARWRLSWSSPSYPALFISLYRSREYTIKCPAHVSVHPSYQFWLIDLISSFFSYLYPDKLLCRHFWNVDQQLKFGEDQLVKRQRANLPLYNELVKLVDSKGSSKEKNLVTDLVTKVTLRRPSCSIGLYTSNQLVGCLSAAEWIIYRRGRDHQLETGPE